MVVSLAASPVDLAAVLAEMVIHMVNRAINPRVMQASKQMTHTDLETRPLAGLEALQDLVITTAPAVAVVVWVANIIAATMMTRMDPAAETMLLLVDSKED
jgi:prophage DNA circulation protein